MPIIGGQPRIEMFMNLVELVTYANEHVTY
jgi:hypothetical protein